MFRGLGFKAGILDFRFNNSESKYVRVVINRAHSLRFVLDIYIKRE